MDEECAVEIAWLRSGGRRLCEVAKFAASNRPDLSDAAKRALLFFLFRLAYWEARRKCATDLVISVTPRHARFYQQVLLFEPLGAPRPYRTVAGTIGVPLRLDLTTADERYGSRYGRADGSLYSFFTNSRDQQLKWLERPRVPLSPSELRYFFVEHSDAFLNAGSVERTYLSMRYPTLDWDNLFQPPVGASLENKVG